MRRLLKYEIMWLFVTIPFDKLHIYSSVAVKMYLRIFLHFIMLHVSITSPLVLIVFSLSYSHYLCEYEILFAYEHMREEI